MPSIVSFFLWQPVHRVLLLLLLACHESCKCSFCFCVLLLLSSWISQEFYPVVWWMNWTCWDLINGKLLWLALRSVENELNIFCTSQILSFTRAGILSYMPKCVYIADLIYWIYSLCLEGWSGLLLAAVAAAEQQQAAQPEAAAQQQQRVGRRQMVPGIGTLRGERTPGVWRAQGGGA